VKQLIPLLAFPILTSVGFATTRVSDGSMSNTQALVEESSPGDIVQIPAGTYTGWGAGWTALNLDKSGVTVTGTVSGGMNQTTIIADPSAPTGPNGFIQFTSGSGTVTGTVLANLKAVGASTNGVMFYADSTSQTWRMTNVSADQSDGGTLVDTNYLFNIPSGSSFGTIDHCTFTVTNSEPFFMRGDPNAWQEPDYAGSPFTAGIQNTLYVEDCTFSGSGSVCDMNANMRACFRFNTINVGKIDGHGLSTNTPAHSFREIEIYGNTNTVGGTFMDLRGGTGLIFGNKITSSGNTYLDLSDMSYDGGIYTAGQYAIPDQVGSGQDQSGTLTISVAVGNPATVTTSAPLNIPVGTEFHLAAYHNPGSGFVFTVGSTIAANSTPALSNSNVNDCVVTGTNTFRVYSVSSSNIASPLAVTVAGTGTLTLGDYSGVQSDPAYAWNNTQMGSPIAISPQYEDGHSMAGIINPNRDYFDGATSVNGIPGVLSGPLSSRPSSGVVVGQGYWATDQGGNWNTMNNTPGDPGYGFGQGALYVWNGSAWVLKYTPYTYPFYSSGPIAPSNLSISSP